MKLRLLVILAIFCIKALYAQSNEDCLNCHIDKSLSMQKNGKTISLFVDSKDYDKSVHKELSCVDCHEGFDAENIPHKSRITPVQCSNCHELKEYTGSIHDKKKISCVSCHTSHYIKPAKEIKTNVNICSGCHRSTDVRFFPNSIHAKKGLTCESCHKSAHNPKIIKSGEANSICLSCHSVDSPKMKLNPHHSKVPKTNKDKIKCIDCHGIHKIVGAEFISSSKQCLTCHLDPKKFSPESNLTKFIDSYRASVHARAGKNGKESASCVDCHGDHITSKTDPKSQTNRDNIPTTCGKCHKEEVNKFLKSDHGIALQNKVKGAPTCTDCHGEHKIESITSSESLLSKKNEHTVCLKCHLDNPDVKNTVAVSAKFLKSYEQSVHYNALHNGNNESATCSDCHGAHEMMKGSNPASLVSKFNISATCGKCHQKISHEFDESIHGVALLRGNIQSASCTDCHGQHQILQAENPNSPVAAANLSLQVCAKCHASVQMSEKFGLPSNKYGTYLDSYHGLAIQGGSGVAANCASCHGVHNIKPSWDPTSTVNKANLVKTCGSCHPGANENFTKDPVHIDVKKAENPILYWISTIYIILIVVIIGGMLIHNLIDFYNKVRRKLTQRRYPEFVSSHSRFPSRLFLRMSLNERIQHGILITTFTTLVITGFMLTYPNSWWVAGLRSIFGDWLFTIRSLLHRIAGALLVAVSLYHLYYITFTPRGKQLIKDMLPKKDDLTNLIQFFRYNLGFSSEPPKFDRFGYVEKAEYWALIWGNIVMGITGFMLWFFKFTINLSGKLITDIATLIHFYEAWLATLAIIIWHLYFVIFNPDVYPMNLAWLKGTISEEEMKHEHPLEYERIMKASGKKSEEE
ncbi:MAG: cytochrome c3 family protein [Ignavibacteria bacterium]|nr:cytochrome c3 family protein [Ignavibacteria bacterium]